MRQHKCDAFFHQALQQAPFRQLARFLHQEDRMWSQHREELSYVDVPEGDFQIFLKFSVLRLENSLPSPLPHIGLDRYDRLTKSIYRGLPSRDFLDCG